MIVQTSEGKWHIYWCVDDAPLSGFAETQKKLSALFGSDPSVCDLPRVMRLPGFPHQKDDSKGELVSLIHTYEGENYRNAVFQEALTKALAISGRTVSPDQNTSEASAHAGQRQTKKLKHFPVPPAPLWSEQEAARLQSALNFIGANGKRVWDPDGDYEAWTTVAQAIASLGWGTKGDDIFVQWSGQATIAGKYPGEQACRGKIRSFKKARTAGCITEATIYGKARDAGWKPSPLEILSNGNQCKTGNANGATTGIILPIIQVVGGGLSNEATEGEEAIIAAGHPIYRRDTMLVRPIIQEVDAAGGRRTKIAQLLPVNQPYMLDLLCRSAKWMRYDRRLSKSVSINPPDDIANVILSRSGEWQFPEIVGVITTPTLRPDGSLLVREGYDPSTRLVLMEPPVMPDIPDRPTLGDGMAALKLLDGLLEEFPFTDNPSRSVALSSLITPVVRGAFTVAPMHAACAPSAGTGKSYLFDIAAAIAIGQRCPVMAAGRNEEETEKRLGAALLTGQPIINIDNVNGELGGDALCQIIERPVVEIRPLGKSKLVSIQAHPTVFATGNNLRASGGMTRRVLCCGLDANEERPELRQFSRDPVAEVLADRGQYVAAALTIVRGYSAAGRPNPAPRLPSFEAWSDRVRSALIWLGRPDPVGTMEAARRDDPDLQAVEAVFAALKHAVGIGEDKASTAAEIINKTGHPQYLWLQEPLLAVAEPRGMIRGIIDPRELGKWLGRHKGRIASGVRLERKGGEHGHTARWWLKDCG
jgi:hypothetical protein